MAKYNDPKTGKTVEASNSKEAAGKFAKGTEKAKVTATAKLKQDTKDK